MDKSKNAVEIFDKYASEYERKFMNVDLYADSLDLFCSNLKKQNATVLELACGPGNITQYLLSKKPYLKILATDLSENMIRLAKENNPTAEFKLMDGRAIDTLNGSFDAVVCSFGLPYFSKEETKKFIADASKIISPGGLIYLSTMEDDYSRSGFKKGSAGEEIFMHYYTADFLTALLKENNFNVLDLRRKIYSSDDGTKTTDLILIGEKKPL